jgi:hypothetical protein
MSSDLNNKLSDQFYRPSTQGWRDKWKNPAISPKEPAGTTAREKTCQCRCNRICVSCYKETYFEKLAFFRSQKTCLQAPRKHHRNTTKNHHKNTHFSQNPLQKRTSALHKHFPVIENRANDGAGTRHHIAAQAGISSPCCDPTVRAAAASTARPPGAIQECVQDRATIRMIMTTPIASAA